MVLDDDDLSLFSRVFGGGAETMRRIAAPARERRFGTRAIMFQPDMPCDEICLILVGTARALFYTADGRVIHLYDLTAGDIYGDLDNAGVLGTEVVALAELRAAMFPIREFLHLAESHGAVGLALSRMLLNRLQMMTGRMLERSTLSAVGRVYAELQRLSATAKVPGVIRPAPALTTIAGWALTTRETTSRAIAALERRGIITRGTDDITIVSPRQLADLVV